MGVKPEAKALYQMFVLIRKLLLSDFGTLSSPEQHGLYLRRYFDKKVR